MPRAKVVHLMTSRVLCGRRDFDEMKLTRVISETTCSNCLIACVRHAKKKMEDLGIDRKTHPFM